MKEKIILALFCIFLIVFSSVNVSALDLDDREKNDLGEIVLINVDKYEPATVSADYLRNKKFPLYVHLTGTTLESFLWGSDDAEELSTVFGGLKIDRIHIVRDSISRYVAGITERPPEEDGYFVDADGKVDLGYLKIDLRRIPKEEDLPDRIDLNFTARIYFDTESSFSVFGKQDLFLELGSGGSSLGEVGGSDEEKSKSRVKVWDGRAEIEFLELRGDRATFQIYDGTGRKLGGPFTLRTGQVQTIRLNDGPRFLDNQVRFKLKGIYGSEKRAKINVYRHGSSNDVELVEDMNLYAGSDWILEKIGQNKVQLRNVKTRQKIILSEGKGDFKTDVCDDVDIVQIDNDELFLKGIGYIKGQDFDEGKFEGKSDSFYCSAINQYEQALSYALGEESSEIRYNIGLLYEKVGDTYKALEVYDEILPDTEFYREKNIQNKIDDLNMLIAEGVSNSKILDGDVRVYLKEVIDVGKEESYIMYRNVVGGIKGPELRASIDIEKFPIAEFTEDGETFGWYIKRINPNEITVVKIGEKTGLKGSPRKLDIGQHILDDDVIEITEISTPYSVIVTAIPGDGRSYGVSNFQVHIPIEKSMIQWTPEQIDNMIDKSHKAVEDIEKIMDKLGNFIKGMKIACFGIYGVLAIKNAFFKDNNVRREVVEEKSIWCNNGIRTGQLDYKKLDECLEDISPQIEEEITNRKGKKKSNDDFFKNNELMKQNSDGINEVDSDSAAALADRLKSDSGTDISGEDIELLLKYDSYTGFTPAEAQRLNYLASYNATEFGIEWSGYKDDIQRAKDLDDDVVLGGYESNPVMIRALAEPKFTTGKTTTTFGSGQGGIESQVKNLDADADVFEARSIQRDGDEHFVSAEGGNEVVAIEPYRDENLNTVEFDDYYLYKEVGLNKHRYFLHKGDVTQLYRKNYGSKSYRALQVNDDGKLWIFPFSSNLGKKDNPLYDKVDYANYVVVDYDSLGKIKSYSLMNVGIDGEINYPGDGDDVPVPRAPYLLWPPSENRNEQYIALAKQVDSEYKRFASRRLIPGKTVSFGGDLVYGVSESAARSLQQPTTQCEYYMSSGDCKLLYNFCDPVMCPASRFDLGNKWNVDNVVQTGIIGSLVLGMPNSIALGGSNIVPPICLTGVHAGLDNIRSKFQGFEDCLQKAKVEGKDVGICNTIRSVYMCEIMWREGLAIFGSLGKLADVVSEKVFGIFGGDGWEYSRWQESWGNLRDNVNFFTTEYARSAFVSYQSRSLGEFGSELCKAAIYGKTPGAGDFLGELLEPDSPYQFTGWFDELEYSSVEEGKSIYRVYYHIYAGRDEDVEYVVYLKGAGLSRNLYVTNPERGIRREFLRKGDYADRSYTVTGDTGYNTMCIFINGKEHCGFGKVSSSYASKQLQDWMLEDELLRTDIESAEECMPDTPHLNPYLSDVPTPSLPGAGAISEQGVVRICSADDPDGFGTRWVEVGTCGNNSVGISLGQCYVDYENSANFNNLRKKDEIADEYIDEEVQKEYDENVKRANAKLDTLNIKVDMLLKDASGGELPLEKINELLIYPAQYLNDAEMIKDSSVYIRAHSKIAEIYNVLGDLQVKEEGKDLGDEDEDISVPSAGVIKLELKIGGINHRYIWENGVWKKSTLPMMYYEIGTTMDSGLNLIYQDLQNYIDDREARLLIEEYNGRRYGMFPFYYFDSFSKFKRTLANLDSMTFDEYIEFDEDCSSFQPKPGEEFKIRVYVDGKMDYDFEFKEGKWNYGREDFEEGLDDIWRGLNGIDIGREIDDDFTVIDTGDEDALKFTFVNEDILVPFYVMEDSEDLKKSFCYLEDKSLFGEPDYNYNIDPSEIIEFNIDRINEVIGSDDPQVLESQDDIYSEALGLINSIQTAAEIDVLRVDQGVVKGKLESMETFLRTLSVGEIGYLGLTQEEIDELLELLNDVREGDSKSCPPKFLYDPSTELQYSPDEGCDVNADDLVYNLLSVVKVSLKDAEEEIRLNGDEDVPKGLKVVVKLIDQINCQDTDVDIVLKNKIFELLRDFETNVDSATVRLYIDNELGDCGIYDFEREDVSCSELTIDSCADKDSCFVMENPWYVFWAGFSCVACDEIEFCGDIQNKQKCDGSCGNINNCEWEDGFGCVKRSDEVVVSDLSCPSCVEIDSSVSVKSPGLGCKLEDVPSPPNGPSGSFSRCLLHPDVNDNLISLNEEFDLLWLVTEAWPPTVEHKSQCHNEGTCVDARPNFQDWSSDSEVIADFYKAARDAGFDRAVYEDSNSARVSAAEAYYNSKYDGQMETLVINVLPHFSLYEYV